MIFLAFLIGVMLPTTSGWLMLGILEGKTPVLLRLERWVLGFVCGMTLTMFLTFLPAAFVGMPLTLATLLTIQLLTLAILFLLYKRCPQVGNPALPVSVPMPLWMLTGFSFLGTWTALKIAAGSVLLLLLPSTFDDTVKNWNFRGKVFFTDHTLLSERSEKLLGQLNSYPPTVSLSKTWLAFLSGSWSEGLVNSLHLLWFLAALALLYWSLRRVLPKAWSFLGVYVLASLPLFLMHGTQAYAEVFVAVHLFAALSMLFHAARAEDTAVRSSFLRLSAFLTALLPFTKNESLVLYLPAVLVTYGIVLFQMYRRRLLNRQALVKQVLWLLIPLCIVSVPWLLYKWSHGFVFGNAHNLSGMPIEFSPLALLTIGIGLFFEGNWLLLFPVLIVLFLLRPKEAFRSSTLTFTVPFLLVFLLQILLFTFTKTFAYEATMQTGFARGIVQILPIACFVAVLLLEKTIGIRE
jgi:hypothetical protein